jgi:hypothetical protein
LSRRRDAAVGRAHRFKPGARRRVAADIYAMIWFTLTQFTIPPGCSSPRTVRAAARGGPARLLGTSLIAAVRAGGELSHRLPLGRVTDTEQESGSATTTELLRCLGLREWRT